MSPAAQGDLGVEGRAALERVLALLARDRASPTSVTEPERAWNVHVADSLAGLEVEALAAAPRIADIGAGAGFPGLPLAAALPAARIDLVESIERKCRFLREAVAVSGLANAGVTCERAETLAAGAARGSYAAATARAVGRLSTVAELASPLLREGGVIVVWKGRRNEEEEAELARAAPGLAMRPEEVLAVTPFEGSRHRHLHLIRKVGSTPAGLPRRPGMAKKRPAGARRRSV